MQRRDVLKLAGIGVAGAVAGCLSATASESDDQSQSSEPAGSDELTIEEVGEMEIQQTGRRTLEVSGTGGVETEPNMATLSVSVEATDRDSASTVVEELAEKSEQLVNDLTAAGIPEDDITTTDYSLRESSRRNQYEGTHRYTIEIDDPDAVGETIDLVADSEADEIRRVNFTITDERQEALYDDAVERAVEGAREEAELYATAADVTLGEPVSIDTSDGGISPFSRSVMLDADAEAATTTELQQGDVTVSAHVTIVYEFEPVS